MFQLQKLTIVAMLAAAAAGAANAQVSLSVDRLDGADPGAPAPAGLVVFDVLADVATTDTWTATGLRASAANGAVLVYGAGNALVNPSLPDPEEPPLPIDPFVTCVSKPLTRAASGRFLNAGAAVAGRYSPSGATATATASELNVAWFASPPAISTSPSVDGYIARLVIDISGAVGIDPATITVSTGLPPAGTVVLLVSEPCSGGPGSGCPGGPAGTAAATFDFAVLSGINWSVYAFPPEADPTVFRYSFTDGNPLPEVPDQGPAGNDAFAGPAAVLSADIPPNGPASGGNRSLDCRVNGATTMNGLLLPNNVVSARGGFTMEAWFKWNGGGSINSIIDSSGTEKLVIDLNSGGPPTVTMRFNDDTDYPIGRAQPGIWQYVAVVFQASSLNPDGTVTGTLTAYLDSLSAPSVASNVTKSNFGDSLGSGIGIGQHPNGFRHPLEFFDGLIHSPRVSFKALNPNQLLLGGDARFRRGDSNGDGKIDIADGVRILNALFLGTAALDCKDAADTNDSGDVDLSDGVAVFNFLFLGGAKPPSPGPNDCGGDPTADTLICESYSAGC